MRDIGDKTVPVVTHVRGHGYEEKPKKMPVPAYLKGTSISDEVISERDLNLIKNRLNAERVKVGDIKIPDEGWKLTPDQTRKGYEFLMDLWKSPTGKERVNNPFGYREQDALENFEEFRVTDFYNAGNMYHDFYVPYYEVIGKNNSFGYAYYGGEIHILG
jgi:hypothetical protein